MTIPELPIYLTETGSDELTVLSRMLDAMAAKGYDRTEGEFAWDFESPVAMELSVIAIALRFALEVGFAQTSFGTFLERRTSEHGVDRLDATQSVGSVRFTAPAGTIIPLGTIVSTVGSATSPAQTFETTAEGTVGVGDTTVDVPAKAITAGAAGNVPPAAIRMLVSTAAGVTAVTNPAAFTVGANEENDLSLLGRYLLAKRTPSAGGNRGDHIKWARDVPGVGGVNVSYPSEGTPPVPNGSVRLSIVDTASTPASPALIREVIDSIVDPVRLGPYEAEAFTVSGFGVTTDATQIDDSGTSQLMVYNASGVGLLTHPAINLLLPQPGIWQVKVRVKVNNTAGSANMIGLGVWNTSTSAYAPATPGGAPSIVYHAADTLSTAFPDALYEDTWLSHDFYWNGSDGLRLEIVRAAADTTTQVWVDQVRYRSIFSDDAGDGKAPAGQRVEVQAAVPVTVNVVATLVIASGNSRATVEGDIEANLAAYLHDLAFGVVNDVQYARVGTVILDTRGITDYSGLTVNGGTGNISISSEQVAVLGATTWS